MLAKADAIDTQCIIKKEKRLLAIHITQIMLKNTTLREKRRSHQIKCKKV